MTEAAEKSGTLITAGLALDFGRDVFAIPGEITKATSSGTNALIRDGQAKLILSATDIFSEYPTAIILSENNNSVRTPKFHDSTEEFIYKLLKEEPLDISSLGNKLDIDIAVIAGKLSMMEIHGMIEMNIDGSYRIN